MCDGVRVRDDRNRLSMVHLYCSSETGERTFAEEEEEEQEEEVEVVVVAIVESVAGVDVGGATGRGYRGFSVGGNNWVGPTDGR